MGSPPENKFSFKNKFRPTMNVSQFIKLNKKSAWPQFKLNIGQTTTFLLNPNKSIRLPNTICKLIDKEQVVFQLRLFYTMSSQTMQLSEQLY